MSGFKVEFSVLNLKATPGIYASSLATRPPAGQPGRLFVDTDNPSTGIYRDTGTVWENITGGASAGNLQTVTDAGNTTDNNILLTYADNTIANALVFYNDALTQEEYLIEKRGTGITTNDSLAIQSRGNISPSTNPVGFLIDGANDIIKSFYTTSYTEVGLKLDFVNQSYDLGNSASTLFRVNDSNGRLQSKYNGDDIGISFDLQNGEYYIGDFDGISNGVFLLVDNTNQLVKTATINGDIGLKLDFANLEYYLGGVSDQYNVKVSHTTGVDIGDIFGAANGNQINLTNDIIKTQYSSNDIGLKLDFASKFFYFGDFDGVQNQTYLLVDDNALNINTQSGGNVKGFSLDFNTNNYYFGDFNSIAGTSYIRFDAANEQIKLYSGVSQYANIICNNNTTLIGDPDAVVNGTSFGVDDTLETLIGSGNLLVGTSGPSSGQHLKVRIGGVDYVIELKDP